jgi:DNA-binding NtrC family response regulator
MPARIVVAHDDPEFVENTVSALWDAGYEVVSFADSMSALQALEAANLIEALITRVRFPDGTPNGVALGRMARVKRRGVKVLFVALPEFQVHTDGVGEFLAMPVAAADVVAKVSEMLEADGRSS